MMECMVNNSKLCYVYIGQVRQTFHHTLPTKNESASHAIAFFWTIGIDELKVIICILYDVKMALRFRWTNIGFLPRSQTTQNVGTIISQIGIYGRRIFSIWYGSISKSSLKNWIPKVSILFRLSKKLFWSLALKDISNVGFAGEFFRQQWTPFSKHLTMLLLQDRRDCFEHLELEWWWLLSNGRGNR